MSCRVIGRTVEAEMLKHLCRIAAALGCHRLRGRFVPSSRNQLVKDLYSSFGFVLAEDQAGTTTWEYDLVRKSAVGNDVIAAWAEAATEPAELVAEPAAGAG
jgi:predicted enzyme involved in methoxymalonyl-ACP biosynthesis